MTAIRAAEEERDSALRKTKVLEARFSSTNKRCNDMELMLKDRVQRLASECKAAGVSAAGARCQGLS